MIENSETFQNAVKNLNGQQFQTVAITYEIYHKSI